MIRKHHRDPWSFLLYYSHYSNAVQSEYKKKGISFMLAGNKRNGDLNMSMIQQRYFLVNAYLQHKINWPFVSTVRKFTGSTFE